MDWIRCWLRCRCRRAFPWLRWPLESRERPTPGFWRRRYWVFPVGQSPRNWRSTKRRWRTGGKRSLRSWRSRSERSALRRWLLAKLAMLASLTNNARHFEQVHRSFATLSMTRGTNAAKDYPACASSRCEYGIFCAGPFLRPLSRYDEGRDRRAQPLPRLASRSANLGQRRNGDGRRHRRQCRARRHRSDEQRDGRRFVSHLLGREGWQTLWTEFERMGAARTFRGVSGEARHHIHAGLRHSYCHRSRRSRRMEPGAPAFRTPTLEGSFCSGNLLRRSRLRSARNRSRLLGRFRSQAAEDKRVAKSFSPGRQGSRAWRYVFQPRCRQGSAASC